MFKIKQGDTSPSIQTRLLDGANPIDLNSVDNINFYIQDKYERVVVSDDLSGRVNIVDQTTGDVEYVFSEDDTLSVGKYQAEWEIILDSSSNRIETFPTNGYQEIEIIEGIQ